MNTSIPKIAALTVVLTVGVAAVRGADEDLIPPEILKGMDEDIRLGKRPRFITIRQDDIFGLRGEPKLDCDFARLGFSTSSLSTVQEEIIHKWIRDGHNPVYLSGNEILDYACLLSPAAASTDMMNPRCVRDQDARGNSMASCRLLKHPVNTDCRSVLFVQTHMGPRLRWNCKAPGSSTCRTYSNYHHWDIPCFAGLPDESEKIVQGSTGKIICGSFPVGKGRIVFKVPTGGTDSRRWELNFWHWALGRPVPGAAETGLASPSGSRTTGNHDVLELKNGDTLTGKLTDAKYTIVTSYAELSFGLESIDRVVLEGKNAKADTLFLRTGDKLTGVIKEDAMHITVGGGQAITIGKDKLVSIQVRKRDKSSESAQQMDQPDQ